MKSSLVILLLVSVIFGYSVSDSLRTEAKKVNDYVINCEFDRALELSNSLLAKDPEEPLYYYLKIATLGLMTLDRDQPVEEELFFATYKSGMELLKSKDNLDSDSYLKMLEGFMYTSYSSFQLLNGNYFSAVSKGKDGLAAVEQSRELDSANHDLDYYLGFFSYARGELKSRVPILFWLDDSSQEGLDQLRRCSASGLFMNRAADMVLVDVMVREGDLTNGEQMLTPMMNEYPESRFLMWTEARLREGQNDTEETIRAYSTLATSYFDNAYYHNGFITALTALDYCKNDREKQRSTAQNFLEVIDRAAVPDSEKSEYNKIYQFSRE